MALLRERWDSVRSHPVRTFIVVGFLVECALRIPAEQRSGWDQFLAGCQWVTLVWMFIAFLLDGPERRESR